uniref:Uncharacterized protein n=1 Tax=Calcidiscus leptoporus TaxID=127549 RepID=A0A7S0JDP8_9EUKA
MRAAEDALHSANLEHKRNTEAKQPVRDEFITSLQRLSAKAIAESEGQVLRFAKIGVLSNLERHALNYVQARAFAKFHNRPLFWWRQPLTGMASGWLNAGEQDKMYHVERAGLCFFFVEGAPATITHNIETGRGLVNGCDATLHSLTMPDGVDLSDYLAAAASTRDGVTEVALDVVPISVNAVPHVSQEARATLLARGATLKADTVQFSLPKTCLSHEEEAELKAEGAMADGHNSIVVQAEGVSPVI